MTTPFERFPDVQRLLVDALVVLVPGQAHTGIETPADLEQVLPFIRVRRNGGARDRFSDRATVDVDVFAATYREAELLAERVAQLLCGPPPPVAVFDAVEVANPPQELPWNELRTTRRFGAAYWVITRRRTVLV